MPFTSFYIYYCQGIRKVTFLKKRIWKSQYKMQSDKLFGNLWLYSVAIISDVLFEAND